MALNYVSDCFIADWVVFWLRNHYLDGGIAFALRVFRDVFDIPQLLSTPNMAHQSTIMV